MTDSVNSLLCSVVYHCLNHQVLSYDVPRLHVDLGKLTNIEHVPSWLPHISCSASVIELQAPNTKEKRYSQQFLDQRALFSHIVWGFSSWLVESSVPVCALSYSGARKHSVMEFPAGLPGIKCSRCIWLDLLGFICRASVLGQCCGSCDGNGDLTVDPLFLLCDILRKLTIKNRHFDSMNTHCPSGYMTCNSLCAQGFPGDFGERGPPGPDGNPVSEMM